MDNATNISSEEELLKLLHEGKLSEAEYQGLLGAIRKSPTEGIADTVKAVRCATAKQVPWQIWVVIAILVFEGISNLLYIPEQPLALIWLGAKCLFILGLLKRWRWVFFLFIVIGVIHVLFFMMQAPIVAAINSIVVALVLSTFRFYFPRTD